MVNISDKQGLSIISKLSIDSFPPYQLTYGFVIHTMSDKTQFPSSYWMSPKAAPQYMGIVQLLLHFRWTWVGLIASDNDGGDLFMRTMKAMVFGSGICLAFTYAIPQFSIDLFVSKQILLRFLGHLIQRRANVILYYGDPDSMLLLPHALYRIELKTNAPVGKVWIATALWGFTLSASFEYWDIVFFHGALFFSTQTNRRSKSQDLFLTQNEDSFNQIWSKPFDCSHPNHRWSRKTWRRCMGREKLEGLPVDWLGKDMSAESCNVYSAVYVVAHAFHALITSVSSRMRTTEKGRLDFLNIEAWQVRESEIRLLQLQWVDILPAFPHSCSLLARNPAYAHILSQFNLYHGVAAKI